MSTGAHIAEMSLSVLVVEDNPSDLRLIRRMLRPVNGAQFEITPASRLSTAIEQLRSGADIVLLDLGLPDSQGMNTLLRMREQDSSVPIIILSGTGDREKSLEALRYGAQDYLIKGYVDAHLLTRAILRHVKTPDAPSSRHTINEGQASRQ